MSHLQSPMTKTVSTVCGTVVLLAASMAFAAAPPSSAARPAVRKIADPEGYPSARTPEAIRAWLKTATSLAPAQVISIGADMVVGFAKTGSLDPVTGYIKGAELRGEALTPQFTKAIQGRSSLATLDVNCTTSSALIHQTKIYSKSNLAGEVTVLNGSGTWITPPKTAYLSEAIDAICRADFKRPLRDVPEAVVAAVSPVKAPVVIAKPATSVATAKSITPLVAPAKIGGTEVQIVAATSAQGAETSRQQVTQRLPQITANRPFRIETAVVGGRTYYRGLFGGFSDRASAAAFCRTLSASNISCLVK
ncbi:MAG: SPOR domain-containing protein [Caulobacteraceae bacterium]|nr:SPOR domain-containing protein [Caulobacteraceae bacterium]